MRYRTLTFLGNNKDQRHAKVSEFFKTESTSRKKWLTDLIKANSKEQVFAAMVELLYSTSCRIGGKGNATKGEPTYGLTTLQVRHLTFTPAAVEFNYSGKKSAEQHHIFKTTTPEGKKIRAILLALVKNKDDTDLVFTFKGKPVLRTTVNSYLRSLGLEITAHKFRQLAGTKVAIGVLRQAPFKKSDKPKQAAVDKWVKEELKKVGEVLHHRTGTNVTGMTAVKSYIDPGCLVEFYDGLGLRIPSWVPASTGAKGSKTEDSDED
jgi:DNA topoisomerase IB